MVTDIPTHEINISKNLSNHSVRLSSDALPLLFLVVDRGRSERGEKPYLGANTGVSGGQARFVGLFSA